MPYLDVPTTQPGPLSGFPVMGSSYGIPGSGIGAGYANMGTWNVPKEVQSQLISSEAQYLTAMASAEADYKKAVKLGQMETARALQLQMMQIRGDLMKIRAQMPSNLQIQNAIGRYDQPRGYFERVMNEGALSQDEVSQMRTGYSSGILGSGREAGAQINQQLASRNLSGNPYAAAIMGERSRFATGEALGKLNADIINQQAQSRTQAAGALTGISGSLAALEATPTQEGMRNAPILASSSSSGSSSYGGSILWTSNRRRGSGYTTWNSVR